VRDVLRALESAGLIAPTGGEHVGGFQMARPAEQVRVSDVLVALRGVRDVPARLGDLAGPLAALLGELDRAGARVADTRTLRDLLVEATAAVG
jgi:DNA-binding IscR family transcriptional regulator